MIFEQKKLIELVELFGESTIDTALIERLNKISRKVGLDIPEDVSKLINFHSEINESGLFWLFDFEMYPIDEIEYEYENIDDECSFFGLYNIDHSFNVSEEHELALFNTSNIGKDDPDELVKNLARFLPIGRESDAYLVCDLVNGGLASIELSTFIFCRAPSIDDHLSDLLLGVQEGVYTFDHHGELDYPREWEKRVIYKSENS